MYFSLNFFFFFQLCNIILINFIYFYSRNFIYPLFIHEADYKEEISSMPDCFRHSLKTMMDEVEEAMK
jgi:delta-aminolevulinic acid dehydratase/porphobilinogen synthase